MQSTRLGILALAAGLLFVACGQATAPAAGLGSPAPSALDFRGIHRVLDRPRVVDGHPLTLYVGAQYCPFCASMRWPLVKALQRFGTFTGLGQNQSTTGVDGFESISTYDFLRASYRSDYITLHLVEVADRNGNALQQPSDDDNDLVNRFDPNGSIPFVFLGGQYVAQLPYSPGALVGHSFKQILEQVDAPNPDELGKAVNDEADAITAAICKTDGAQPASVCRQPTMSALITRMP